MTIAFIFNRYRELEYEFSHCSFPGMIKNIAYKTINLPGNVLYRFILIENSTHYRKLDGLRFNAYRVFYGPREYSKETVAHLEARLIK